MKKIIVEDMIDVAQIMYDKVVSGCESVCFAGYYEDAAQLIKELLMMYDDTNVMQIKIEMVEWDGYEKEYLVTLDDEMNVWCEKAFNDYRNDYFYIEDSCVLVADDCNSRILENIEADEVYEVSYDLYDEHECDGDCKHCCLGSESEDLDENCKEDEELSTESKSEYHNISKTKDGRIAGFSTSWTNEKDGETSYSSFSYYGDNEATVKRLAKEFGINI